MADSKITKKHHPSGSLTRRMLLISLLLLVVPLFLQTLFLYKQEYDQKLEDVQIDLQLLGKERVRFLEETIQLDWQILEQGGGNKAHRFVVVSQQQDALLVGIANPPNKALVLPIPFKEIAKDLSRTYPIRISVLNQAGSKVWGNRILQKGSDLLKVVEPITGTAFSLQLDVEKNDIRGLHRQSYYFRLATLIFFVGFIGGGAVYFFTRRVSLPLKSLCKTMQKVSEGALHARYPPDRMGFEINALGLQFNETLDALLQSMQEAEKERLARERLAGELRMGHEIQASLLPAHLSILPGVDIASVYLAAQEVNGDFYDLFRLENGQILIAICDTAGKGISACLFSLGLRSMLRALANVTTDLADLVRRTNDLYLFDANHSSMFATAWLGLYDPKKHKLIYCSQGHPPAILLKGSKIEELWTEGIAFGTQKVDLVSTKEIILERGDLVILYTDGITEAHDTHQHLFGKERLFEIVAHEQNASAQQIADRIIEKVHLFSQGAPQHDDMTLVVFQIPNVYSIPM